MVRNLIFDFGGVLLDLDYRATERALSDVLGIPFEINKLDKKDKEILDKYEKGLISTESFLWKLQKMAVGTPDPLDIITAWNAMLLGIKAEKLAFIKQLRSEFKVYLLSNTNELHMNHVFKYLESTHNITDFNTQYFDRAYYSHLLHMRKPDGEIFNHIVAELKIKKEESVFIDDLAENVQSAIDCGLKGFHFEANKDFDSGFLEALRLLV